MNHSNDGCLPHIQWEKVDKGVVLFSETHFVSYGDLKPIVSLCPTLDESFDKATSEMMDAIYARCNVSTAKDDNYTCFKAYSDSFEREATILFTLKEVGHQRALKQICHSCELFHVDSKCRARVTKMMDAINQQGGGEIGRAHV